MSKERQMQDCEFELHKARYTADYSWRGGVEKEAEKAPKNRSRVGSHRRSMDEI